MTREKKQKKSYFFFSFNNSVTNKKQSIHTKPVHLIKTKKNVRVWLDFYNHWSMVIHSNKLFHYLQGVVYKDKKRRKKVNDVNQPVTSTGNRISRFDHIAISMELWSHFAISIEFWPYLVILRELWPLNTVNCIIWNRKMLIFIFLSSYV